MDSQPRMGDIVRWADRKATPYKRTLLGIVGYAPYRTKLCNVTWQGRLHHDIVLSRNLKVVLTKRQANAVSKLVDGN